MRRIGILRLASVAALALIPLACNDLGTGPDYRRDNPQDLTPMLNVDPDVARLQVGDGLQLKATIGHRLDPLGGGDAFTWESSDPLVAAVDGEGRVVALAPGEATITVGYGRAEADVMILVLTPYDDLGDDHR